MGGCFDIIVNKKLAYYNITIHYKPVMAIKSINETAERERE
jgi:hypothetical protein